MRKTKKKFEKKELMVLDFKEKEFSMKIITKAMGAYKEKYKK